MDGRERSQNVLETPRTADPEEPRTELQDGVQIARALERSRPRETPPATVPGYAISRSLGEGAYGSVWLAREQNTGKQVAIKFYTHRRGVDWSLLNREVEKLAVLYTSRNIVRLSDVGWDADPPYYVMEYLENGSLDGFLNDGALPVHEAVRIAESVLRALVHAHGRGILHCDLKPANVLLDHNFEPRICDFGQSRLSHEQKPALGTLFYMAPEQADLKAVPDARWDVYALGALLYHMLCGAPPHRTPENEQRIREAADLEERLAAYRRIVRESPRPDAHRKVSGVDRRLAEIVDRCLEVDPSKRFPNSQAVLDALEQRERHRTRRPLITLGIIGPTLLILAMVPIIGNALRAAVNSARENLTERALESNAVSARILAFSLERELDRRLDQLESLADSSKMRESLQAAAGKPWDEREAHFEWLVKFKDSIEASWFINDAEGYQRWREPYDKKTIDQNFAWRDYFHGLNTELDPDRPETWPADLQPIRDRHISHAFRSDATLEYMVALAVPIWDEERRQVIGVLARTVHLGDLLANYKARLQGEGENEVARVIALADNRGWELLDHEWMTQENLAGRDPTESFVLSKRFREKLARLGRAGPADGNDRDPAYEDPIGQLAPDKYGGTWLAAFAPVGQTGWTAIVQEPRPAALRPIDAMQSEVLSHGLWAIIVSCTLVGLLWYFVARALSDRGPAAWVPSGTSRNGGVTSGSGSASGTR